MNKLENDLEKFENVQKRSAEEEANMIRTVNEYIEGRVRQGESREKIRRYYINKYIDFLEQPSVQPIDKEHRHKPLTPDEKMAIIMREVYREITKIKGRDQSADQHKAA